METVEEEEQEEQEEEEKEEEEEQEEQEEKEEEKCTGEVGKSIKIFDLITARPFDPSVTLS